MTTEDIKAQVEEIQENVNEAVEEMKSAATLTDVLQKKSKYAERTIVTYLDYDSAIEAFELQDYIAELNTLIEEEEKQVRSITDEPDQELVEERDKAVDKLVALNDVIQESRLEWTVTGIPPKVWRVVDKTARQKFPIAKDIDENEKTEIQIKRNEWVNRETLRRGIVKLEFATGEVFENVTEDEAQWIIDELPVEVVQPAKDKIDELTFANRGFQEAIESADFLSMN